MTSPVRERPHYVYRAFTGRGRLLYVGCTSNLESRRRDHRMFAQWFRKAKRWDVDGPYDYATARHIEIDAIHAERPACNRTGRWSNFGKDQALRSKPIRSAA